ncbi:MAG: SHOCT domain-containing protein [Acidimicrobiales bacterium]
MFKALRQKMKDATLKASEAKQSASSRAAAAELARLIERHDKGLIGDEEFTARKAYLEKGI